MKDSLPGAVRRPLGIVRTLIRRLNTWGKVARSISGVSTKDKRILRHAVLRAPITVFRNLGQWQFPMVEKDCSVISRGIGTFHVRAQTDDLFHVLSMQEPSVETSIRSILRPGDTFIDAGANIGFYTVPASCRRDGALRSADCPEQSWEARPPTHTAVLIFCEARLADPVSGLGK